ncbi:unnamed protein product [Clonostachys chloroleuca]|uniref:Sulphur transport domain-containing protein n=1 Tax=Clonostachys chloroleuca TaxID=1926264 RepID=A0AA35MIC9_9HYPO|nr:unnamed protein product [Clonostachys chloroleuca]
MASFISGAAFGAAMFAAGFHHPSVIVAQLKFENFHMIQAFLTATATSAIVYTIAEKFNYTHLKPRSNSPLGLFAKYDGNIVGGGLLGAGMALSASCPGTLIIQAGAGVGTSVFSLSGAILGGIAWTGFLGKLINKTAKNADLKSDAVPVGDHVGLSGTATLVALETVFTSIIVLTTLYTPAAPEPKLLGAIGGLLIGSAQAFSILTRRSMVGVSSFYDEAGQLFWWILSGFKASLKPTSLRNTLFATGMFSGVWLLAKAAPTLVGEVVVETSPVLATLGAFLMIIGARTAGGCTSGHGISGISLLSTSSMITIASTFGVGAVVAAGLS